MIPSGTVAVALVTAMVAGVRRPSILDFAAGAGLLFGFLNAVDDLIEAEGPAYSTPSQSDAASGPVLHIIRHRGEIGEAGADREAIRLEGLEVFGSER